MIPWALQFSLPQEVTNEQVFDTIVTTHGVAVATWLLDRYGEEVARASEGLVEFIRAWIGNPGASPIAWDLSFGRAHLTLKENKLDPVEAALRVGLRIAMSKQRGKWQARVAPIPVQIDDRVIKNVEQIEVDSESEQAARITFELTHGAQVSVRRASDGNIWTGDTGKPLESVGRSGTVYLLPRKALPSEERGGEIFKECQPVAMISPEMSKSFHDGFAVLEQNAPQYVPWVERVLHGIVVCPRQAQYRLVSGSWEDVPGFVHMSSPHGGIDIAEVLVHESAHQYFYMLQRVGAVDDSSDGELYWSPPIRKKRPLSRILMAYHALANVQLLYEAVRLNDANGLRDINYVKANEPDLWAAIQSLDEPLRDNPALTKLGHSLYDPLAARMAAFATQREHA